MINYILLDIEGTTSDIEFVHKVLFPYSYEKMESYLRENFNNSLVSTALEKMTETLGEAPNLDTMVSVLKKWINEDLKHPALKMIQAPIWKVGFETGAFKSHLYDDVLPQIECWKSEGKKIGIYSSGSVSAQKLFFKHTTNGDVLSFFSNHFDLSVGGKKDEKSYTAILQELGEAADQVAFLSDVGEELDAAAAAGMKTVHLIRPGTAKVDGHYEVENFSQINWQLCR